MLPTQQYDGIPPANPSPPWTPLVWQEGPDGIVADAQKQLWLDQSDLQTTLGPSESSLSMSGSHTSPENETDMLVDGTTPGDSPSHGGATGRASEWHSNLLDLYRDEPLASWATGAKDGPPNPAS
jgi:hypothetical protein